MDKKKIHYMLHSGKNSNLKYYIRSYLREYTPKIFFQMQLNRILRQLDQRQDKEEIMRRVNYSCKLDKGSNFNKITVWYEGLTKPCDFASGVVIHSEDKESVVAALQALKDKGLYPQTLWD